MSRWLLVRRSLVHYWRTNLAVVAGVATAVAVLTGALLVGHSVRGTLHDLAFQRLGATTVVVSSTGFFREALATDLAGHADTARNVAGIVPLIVGRATVAVQGSDEQASAVSVYGVDARFWQFHGLAGRVDGPGDRGAFVSPVLARRLGLEIGEAALVRLQRPSDVPLESLHGRKDDVGHTMRVVTSRVLARDELGEFTLEMQQGDVLAIFVPLARLQDELELGPRVNALLASAAGADATAALERALRRTTTLADVGLRVTPFEARRAVVVDSESGLLDPALATATSKAIGAAELGERPVLTYLANTIRLGSREVPYSLVSALDLSAVAPAPISHTGAAAPIVLNAWAARDLQARVGDEVELDYDVWEDPGQLVTRTASFVVAAIVPVVDTDRRLAPTYPGITDSPTLDSWDPPFPLDLRRIRPIDERYWAEHRTTPKAYLPLEVGQRLWSSRFGSVTSIQAIAPGGQPLDAVATILSARLRAAIDPFAAGMQVTDVESAAVESSAGTTNFGEYFVYFSFFLVVSALLLAALFFKLGVEQRAREVGLLRAVGIDAAGVRRLMMVESLLMAVAGSLLGVVGALAYAWLVITGLGTWWYDAVGTTSLTVHVAPSSLAVGGIGGLAAAVICTWWTLLGLQRISERSLLAGDVSRVAAGDHRRSRVLVAGVAAALAGLALVAAGMAGAVRAALGFFGAGAALLVAALCWCAWIYRSPARHMVSGHGFGALVRLGLRYASVRPARSVLSIAIVASAAFILIAVDGFRRGAPEPGDPRSGTGGYALFIETLLPIVHDVSTSRGRSALNLVGLDAARLQPFRLRPGDDASCLNLYRPQNPRILGARADFIEAGRFTFHASLASTETERQNPWLLLNRAEPDDAIPAIADANSMTYVLHRSLGDDLEIEHKGRRIRLRFVGALADSVFQSELLISESRFEELFPDSQGYRVLMAETTNTADVSTAVEGALADFGPTVVGTVDRLAAFHRVENTYLSTFQTLGGLGLLLGTVGLAAVLLRNALERRRELALLAAFGYRRSDHVILLSAETLSLLVAGLGAGALAAVVATWPALASRGTSFPMSTTAVLLLVVVGVGGLVATALAARLATRAPMLSALRSE